MEARLPPDKIQKFVDLLDEFVQRSSYKKQKMESLISYLSFTCSVVLREELSCHIILISLIMDV